MGDINDDADNMSMWDHKYVFCGKEIHIREDYDAGLGGTMFDGAACLANYLEYLYNENPEFMKGKVVVELGSGCGLPGILCGLLGAKAVYLTDILETCELLLENVLANKSEEENVFVRVLNWNSESDLESVAQIANNVDYILAADTIYTTQAVPVFLKCLERLSQKGTRILFAHPKARGEEASELFWKTVPESFHVEKIPNIMFSHGIGFQKKTEGVFVLRLQRKDFPGKRSNSLEVEDAEYPNFTLWIRACCGYR